MARFERDYARSLNNYAVRLDECGQHAKALVFSRQALEILEKISQKDPIHYEPEFANALSDHANVLRNNGQFEAVKECRRRSLEINKRLAETDPDRFESGYAISLGNYVLFLCEIGQYHAAFDAAQTTLKIRSKLNVKAPSRFAEELFSSSCIVVFLHWMLDVISLDYEGLKLIDMPPAIIPSQHQALSWLYSSFVKACCYSKFQQRNESMKQVLTTWEGLSFAEQQDAQPYWLCAAAWCATYSPETVADLAWQTDWQKFAKQRQGRIPCWMLEVARRLEFQWPDWTEQSDGPITPVAGQP